MTCTSQKYKLKPAISALYRVVRAPTGCFQISLTNIDLTMASGQANISLFKN
jgi:hypothetical protein